MRRIFRLIIIGFLFASVGMLSAKEVEQYFNQNCKVCHTIGGGKIIGPDLKGVSERADRDWLVKWMLDPAGVLASGDAYAQKILKESNGVPMIASAGMNATLAGQILDYIDTQSSITPTEAPVEIVFTDEDIAKGYDYFTGSTSFENGAPSCITCHAVNSLAGLGGGKLGVNLTDVVDRLGGARGLSGWLISPPVPTMAPIFADKKLISAANKILNVDKKSLHLNHQILNENKLKESPELFYSIQFFVSSDYDKIILTLNNFINNYENIYKKEDFYVVTLKSELGIDYFLLYKNFNNRELAKDHCSKYISQIDNCLIVNVQNFNN